MDEAASEERTPVTPPADDTGSPEKSPEELRQDVEQTREQLGDTVQALAEKTDVKAQARERITAIKDTAREKKQQLLSKADQSTPGSVGTGTQQVASAIKQRPIPFATAGAFVVGLLVGRLFGRGRRS